MMMRWCLEVQTGLGKPPCFWRASFNPDSDAQDQDHLHARSGDGED
jgi:hypothetical protein